MAQENTGIEPQAGATAQDAGQADFAPTQPETAQDIDPDWWSESTDGRCSESAALFAASQPAPLSIV